MIAEGRKSTGKYANPAMSAAATVVLATKCDANIAWLSPSIVRRFTSR